MMQPRFLKVRQIQSSSARVPANLNRVRGVFNCKCDRGTRVVNRESLPGSRTSRISPYCLNCRFWSTANRGGAGPRCVTARRSSRRSQSSSAKSLTFGTRARRFLSTCPSLTRRRTVETQSCLDRSACLWTTLAIATKRVA
jgi:hypothetical protein